MPAEVWRGHVDVLLLSVLEREPAHGYGIVEAVRAHSSGVFDLAEGTVYPALYRLEAAGLASSRWHVVDGRRRRIYRLTPRGSAALERGRRDWRSFSDAMDVVLA